MGEDPGEGRPSVGDGPAEQDPGGPKEMRARIEETREELGDTVAALAAKTDVKAQAKRRVAEAKERLSASAEQTRTKVWEALPPPAQERATKAARRAKAEPLPAVAVVGAAVLLIIVLRRRS